MMNALAQFKWWRALRGRSKFEWVAAEWDSERKRLRCHAVWRRLA